MESAILLSASVVGGFTWMQFILIFIGALLLIQIIRHFTRKSNDEEQAMLDAWHDDPENWKAGIFYYNPKDKRLFPPKRISGMGWTINFANPISILAMLALILFIFLVAAGFNLWM